MCSLPFSVLFLTEYVWIGVSEKCFVFTGLHSLNWKYTLTILNAFDPKFCVMCPAQLTLEKHVSVSFLYRLSPVITIHSMSINSHPVFLLLASHYEYLRNIYTCRCMHTSYSPTVCVQSQQNTYVLCIYIRIHYMLNRWKVYRREWLFSLYLHSWNTPIPLHPTHCAHQQSGSYCSTGTQPCSPGGRCRCVWWREGGGGCRRSSEECGGTDRLQGQWDADRSLQSRLPGTPRLPARVTHTRLPLPR